LGTHNVEEEESNGNLDEKQLEGDDGVEEKALEVNTVTNTNFVVFGLN
jgi:hypothetical protein